MYAYYPATHQNAGRWTYSWDAAQAAGHKAGALLQQFAALGGGNPESARGAAPDRAALDAILAAARSLLLP